MFSAHPAISQAHALLIFNRNIWIFSSLIFVVSAQSEFFFFDERQIAFFSSLTDDATFSCMIDSTDIVGRKQARRFPLYSESYYIAESDFFSFHTIQMQKMSYFKVEPRRNVTILAQLRHSNCFFIANE